MPPRPPAALLLLILAAVGSAAEQSCSDLLQEFRTFTSANEAVPHADSSMLFFLHMPRTAGGTLNCLLRAAVDPKLRCPSAYKALADATKVKNCTLIASHDDFSAMQQLPAGATAVITELRDPVDRVLSAYEFAIEQAAQRINRTKQQASTQLSEVLAVSLTDDVWPWNYLVPFFEADITPRIEKLRSVPLEPPGVWTIQRNPEGTRFYWNKVANASKASLSEEEQKLLVPELDAYENDVVMSLKEFLDHPVAADLLHNGEILQVLGLTNYSSWPKAAALRSCMLSHDDIAGELLQLAKQRLESFTYVGATSKLKQSVEELVSSLGMSFDQTAHPFTEAELQATVADMGGPEGDKQQLLQKYKQYLAANKDDPLSEEFHKCAAAGRSGAANRRSRNLRRLRLNDWRQIYFDKEDRQGLPQEVLDKIRGLNALDGELFNHAQLLMTQQRERLQAAGKLQLLPPKKAQGPQPSQQQQGPKPQRTTPASGMVGPGLTLPEGAQGMELDEEAKQRIQEQLMQQLQKMLSQKGKSEL